MARQHLDPFEPNLILDGLRTPGHLGHLIFSRSKWLELCPDAQKWPAPSDPLTRFYLHLAHEDPEYLGGLVLLLVCVVDKCLLDHNHHLDLKKYDTLEVPWRSWVNTCLYKVNGDALWSLMYVRSL